MSCSINGIISFFSRPETHVTSPENSPLNGANPVASIMIFLKIIIGLFFFWFFFD